MNASRSNYTRAYPLVGILTIVALFSSGCSPAALDAAFQAMILWTEAEMNAPSLPSFAARYRQYVERFPERGVRVVVKAVKRALGLAGADIEFLDERGALVAKIEGFECAADASLAAAFRRNAVEATA